MKLDLTVGWQFDLVVGVPILLLGLLGLVIWANTGARRWDR